LIAITTLIFFGGSVFVAQSSAHSTVAKFPASYLKWMHVAEAEFQKKHLDLDNYIVSVIDEDENVTVYIRSSDARDGSKGSGGTHVGYEVEISKKDSKVVRSSYLR
jgi:hypothetical protein